MAKSIKFKNNVYLDSSSVTYNKIKLNEYLGKIIETGYENGVYWTKYDTGKLVQTFNQQVSVDSTRSSGGISYFSGSANVNLPIAFKNDGYRAFSNIILANMNYFANSYVAATGVQSVVVSLATTEENSVRVIQVALIGEWK